MIATSNGRARLAVVLLALLVLVGCQSTTMSGQSGKARAPSGEAAADVPEDAGTQAKPSPEPPAEEPPGEDLWAAMRAGFALDHEIDQPRVRAEIDALTRYPNHLVSMRERLELYLPHIHEQVRARGFPAEIALLPILESGMNPHAEAFSGPAGLWQFIPATADRLGLPRNWWYDGRRDPVLSTEAALDYLDYLHSRFGDWRLAIVAYNTGEGTVTRALERVPESASFWSLRLPHAGMVFVPKLLALAELVANPERNGVTLPELSTAPPFKTVPTGGQVQIGSIADALGVDEDALYLLNPALNRTATPPEGPHQLNVPSALTEQARAWLAGLDREQRVEWDRVQVVRGDTLGGLARRHGTDVRTLRELNNLQDDRLRAGEYLFIPATAGRPPAGTASAGQRAAGGLAAAAAAPARGRAADAPQANRSKFHTVRPGDTLWQIARTYRTSVDRLAAANDLKSGQVLKIGQRLTIPGR